MYLYRLALPVSLGRLQQHCMSLQLMWGPLLSKSEQLRDPDHIKDSAVQRALRDSELVAWGRCEKGFQRWI